MRWRSRPAGVCWSISLRKRRNSRCRCRGMHAPITRPCGMSPRRGGVESLDLALFVDTEDQRLVGRIEIKPDHVLHLGGEVLIARDFESLDQVRLETGRLAFPPDTGV